MENSNEQFNFSNLTKDEQTEAIKTLSKQVTPERWEKMLEALKHRTRYISLVLEDIYQAHNAAAAVRTCEGLGIQDIHVIERRNELNLTNTTVAKGADKWLTTSFYKGSNWAKTTQNCLQSLKDSGHVVVGTSLDDDSVTLEEVSLGKPLAVVIGTEMNGLSPEAVKVLDIKVKLPMYGFTQSYNLSVCAAMVLKSLADRIRSEGIKWQLTQDEKRELTFEWLTRCIGHWKELL